jgi:hypothetical protein
VSEEKQRASHGIASSLRGVGHASEEVGHRLLHGRHARGTCRPLRHSTKELASDGAGRLRRVFGLLPG